MAGLTSERMRRLLTEARESFDWVIIDTPPVMLLPDAHLLASMVDGAVLVVRASSTPHEHVKRAAETIGRQRILGVVLNRAEASAQPAYGAQYYYGYYLRDKRRTRPGHDALSGPSRLTARSLMLVACETLLIVAAVAAAAYVRLGDGAWDLLVLDNGCSKALLVAAVAQSCMYYADLYDLRIVVRSARAVHADSPGARLDLVRCWRRSISGSPR